MIQDFFTEGIQSGWIVRDGAQLQEDLLLETEVVVIGTGAGGGVSAEILSQAGKEVLMIEEGPLKTSSDFHMKELEAYPSLYQESGSRKTADRGITIYQGRAVGGSTTVNWTTSFRTPEETLRVWQERHGLVGFSSVEMQPWFDLMEKRLGISDWLIPPNENNDVLRRGCEKLGIPTHRIRRNVKGCFNLGYCGMGCPTNAKQSQLVTTIPKVLESGGQLFYSLRAEYFVHDKGQVKELVCSAMDQRGTRPGKRTIRIRAKSFILAAGAIGSPALLLRSNLPDPYQQIGRRTFLHPVCVSGAVMPFEVSAHFGAPQTIYSDHFLQQSPPEGPIGYKLEVPPVHPVLAATTLKGFGLDHVKIMKEFPNLQITLALMRDGFHEESQGGQVKLKKDKTPVLDYPLTPYLWEGVRRALLSMAEIQFAAGAKQVLPVHEDSLPYTSWKQAKVAIEQLPMEVLKVLLVSAHVMGGCAMGQDESNSVVDSSGKLHSMNNVYVIDGSAFPTSVGANPQLSIYALAAKQATQLLKELKS